MAQTLIAFDDLRLKGITLSRTQIWRNERAGKFPKRVQLSAARVAWVESEVDGWIADRIAARDDQKAHAA
jgi:prophage regulatory protein